LGNGLDIGDSDSLDLADLLAESADNGERALGIAVAHCGGDAAGVVVVAAGWPALAGKNAGEDWNGESRVKRNHSVGVATVIQALFVLIAAAGLAAALGTILARNLVRAALYLVAFFFTVACVFVLLEAEFLAALQVLIYIGAVAIILMFGIMLTRNIQGDDPTHTPSAWKLPGLVAGFGVFLVLAFGITYQHGIGQRASWAMMNVRPGLDEGTIASPRALAINDMAKSVGNELLTRYVIAFETAGLLLTVALVGAIAIAHREEGEPVPPRGGAVKLDSSSASPSNGSTPVAVVATSAPAAHVS
jgi:NADH:ubiquinone oxidoreductase subunit 6 (subunit J)